MFVSVFWDIVSEFYQFGNFGVLFLLHLFFHTAAWFDANMKICNETLELDVTCEIYNAEDQTWKLDWEDHDIIQILKLQCKVDGLAKLGWAA